MAEHTHHSGARSVLRPRVEGEHSRVSFFELFFDLVFVFAITQLSHSLAGHLDFAGAVHTLVLLLAIWWAWIYTTWATNWLDPDHVSVRLMLTALMLGGLIMSAAIPQAFDGRAFAFALPYVAIQVGRTAFLLWATRAEEGRRRTFTGILVWFCVSAAFWIAGAAAADDARLALWVIALAIEYAGPSARYWLPVFGSSRVADWNVEGAHVAERCGLFMIIALGESLLVTGAPLSGLEWTRALVIGMVAAFGTAVAMWWIYFDVTAELGSERIAHSDDPGRVARLAYTYIYLLMIAGIILTAVGDEAVLAHPTGDTPGRVALVILGGPAVFLVGHWLFKRAVFGSFSSYHPAGLLLLGGGAAAYAAASPVVLTVYTTGVLAVVGLWASLAYRRQVAEGIHE